MADALFHIHDEPSMESSNAKPVCLYLISRPSCDLLENHRKESTLPDLVQLHHRHHDGTFSIDFSMVYGMLYYYRRYVISTHSSLKQALLHEYHSTLLSGHACVK